MGVQLVRIGPRTDHVQVPGSVCGAEEIAHRQRGPVPVPEHVPVGQCGLVGERDPRVSAHGRGEDGECARAVRAGGHRYRRSRQFGDAREYLAEVGRYLL